MLLMYDRTYTTHAFLGSLSGVGGGGGAVGRNIDPLQPLPAGVFRIPERRVAPEPDELRGRSSAATERPTPRPTRGQGRFDSGEEKRHAVKHQVVVVRERKTPGRTGQRRRVRIAAASGALPGKTHDEKVYDRTRVVCPPGVQRTGDTAYLGTGSTTPRRKPREGESPRDRRRGTVGCRGVGSWSSAGSGR